MKDVEILFVSRCIYENQKDGKQVALGDRLFLNCRKQAFLKSRYIFPIYNVRPGVNTYAVAAIGQSGIQECLVGKRKSVFTEKMLENDPFRVNVEVGIPTFSMKFSKVPIILIREIGVHNYG